MQDDIPTNPDGGAVDDGGAVGRALTHVFGRSYRTTIAGVCATIAGGIVAVGTALPGFVPHQAVVIAAALAPIFGGAGLLVSKDARVSGLPK
jgi:hypothetical protein